MDWHSPFGFVQESKPSVLIRFEGRLLVHLIDEHQCIDIGMTEEEKVFPLSVGNFEKGMVCHVLATQK